MERVDHIHVIQICGGRFVGQIYRMAQRQVPDRESLEFGITRFNPPLMFMIQLGEAGGHFSAAGSGGSDDGQGLGGFDIIIFPVPLIADNMGNIAGIPFNNIMKIRADAQTGKVLAEMVGGRLPGILCDDHASHI